MVDDGSRPPIVPPAASLDLKIVRQARDGFGLARARNAGVRAAAHDILVFLDCDVIPEAGLIRAHARWHQTVGDALTVGFCNYVSAAGVDPGAVRARPGSLAELFAGRPFDPPWIERHMARTADLTSRHADLFRAVTGHNFGISRALFEAAGGFDEAFRRYGGEDTEFAYRAQVLGGLLVPERAAFGWHQGRWADGREAKQRDMERQAEKLAGLIAEPGFRPIRPRRRYPVPRHVVTLDVRLEAVGAVAQAAGNLLADPEGDLAVCIEVAAGREEARARLTERFVSQPRVIVAPAGAPDARGAPVERTGAPCAATIPRAALDAFPASPLHIRAPAAAVLRWGPTAAARRVAKLGSALATAAYASADAGHDDRACIARAWAYHRALRAGGGADDYGDTRTLTRRASGVACAPGPGRGAVPSRRRAGAAVPQPAGRGLAVLARVWSEARHVRGIRTGWRFVQWLAGAARWRLRGRTPWRATPAPAGATASVSSVESRHTARADAPLGARIAVLGPRARAVFAASTRVTPAHAEPAPDAVLADTPAVASGVDSPVALLSETPALAVPAFDPALDNPVGWVRHVEPRVLALGPPGCLPPQARAHRAVRPGDRDRLRHCHHVEDGPAYHAGVAQRAGTLARVAAGGTVVRLADADPALAGLLGAELHALMTDDRIRGAGAAEREALSIAQRRLALRTHSLVARAREVCRAAGAAPPPWPRISVLLATRRPAWLAHAVGNVARQAYPSLELVLALHGPGFDPGAVDAALAGFAHPVHVLSVDAAQPLGSVLDAASTAATGELLAKMDDDDVYGREHLWDLVLAHGYSGAMLVGKFPAAVYLAARDRTVRRRAVPAETWSRSITGGTMLIAREDLARAGGWRPLPRHVDEALVGDVLRVGGGVYRTHDQGYLLVRHGRNHTWRRDDAAFLAGAEANEPGCRPELAGLADLPAPAAERLARLIRQAAGPESR